LRVIHARLVGDAKIGAEESGSELPDELLDRVSVIAEALAELPIAAALVARPVGQFMADGSARNSWGGGAGLGLGRRCEEFVEPGGDELPALGEKSFVVWHG
jgi:hypothetical protein